jgi:hypothetical protein
MPAATRRSTPSMEAFYVKVLADPLLQPLSATVSPAMSST